MSEARYGWSSNFPDFRMAEPRVVRGRLQDFLPDVDASQLRAWDDSIPKLQREVGESLDAHPHATEYSAILEYQLPLEFRRPDVLLLVGSAVIVLELKGKDVPSQADIDQTAAYARDLRAYHRDCDGRPVYAVVVPTRARGYQGEKGGVHIAGPDTIDALILPNLPMRATGHRYPPKPSLTRAHTGHCRHWFRRRESSSPPAPCAISGAHVPTPTPRLIRSRRSFAVQPRPSAAA